jgi:UDP-N-acetylmuramyl pentapeptide phosphotransferase/UDP-N-acetylglucosamine-1-phosphate transferase
VSNWIASFVAGTATVILLAILLRRPDALPVDHPNERSLHHQPTPRIGGLALFPGVVLGCLAAGSPNADSMLLLGLAGFLFLLSIFDDWRGLAVALRFGAHLLAAALLAAGLMGASPFVLAGALAVAWMTNLVNFMDGANGLAGGMAAIGFAAFGLASGEPALAFALVGAALGFLMFNFDPARVFLGDAGSIPLGFLAGGLGLLGVVKGQWPWWFPLLAFSPFVADATVTLLRRMLRREKFWIAHREHYYQRLVRMGWSHRRLALAEYALMAACGGSALALRHADFSLQMLGLSLWVAAYAGLMLAIDGRWANSEAHRGASA